MADSNYPQRREFEQMPRAELRHHQLAGLNQLLETILPANGFYASKFSGVELPLKSLDQLAELPLTTKSELVQADRGELPSNQSFPPSHFVHWHRTSGTRGRPMQIMDTAADWQSWIEVWQYVLDSADITPDDRALMAFSFGPFIGFWSAYDALAARGVLVIPAGGLSTAARIDLAMDSAATVLCCTPTYALRMEEVARELGKDLTQNNIRKIIVAGEPGGSLPAVRQRIESAWDAQVFDHAGATEVGPWGFADENRSGLHVAESHFIAEFLPSDIPAKAGDEAPQEMVLTTLSRYGMPVIRYRTGDLVRPIYPESGNRFVLLQGGVLLRADDMVVIRGVNVFPSSLEEIMRSFDHVGEFRIVARKVGTMDDLLIEIEDQSKQQLDDIQTEMQSRIGLRVALVSVANGTLPRFEAKSKRFVDQRNH
jgi:phenylacetate-CoA ligase